jgi:hypothetical protein
LYFELLSSNMFFIFYSFLEAFSNTDITLRKG